MVIIMSEEDIIKEFKNLIYNDDFDYIELMDEDGFTGWHELFENILKLYNKEKEKNRELEEIVKTYNAIPNDYIPNDMKIVIADREYFNNGILKENIIPKSKVREKIEEYNKMINATYGDITCHGDYRRNNCIEIINILQELLEERN